MNIISNAIDSLEKAIDEQKLSNPLISILTEIDLKQQVKIHIADNGMGIPVKIQSRLFDPFFTTKPTGKGTGMGLSICYQIIVEKHGGTLEYHSEPGQETIFTITIPQTSRGLQSPAVLSPSRSVTS